MSSDLYQEVYTFLKKAIGNYPCGIPTRLVQPGSKLVKFDRNGFLILVSTKDESFKADSPQMNLLDGIIKKALGSDRNDVPIEIVKEGRDLSNAVQNLKALIDQNQPALTICFGRKFQDLIVEANSNHGEFKTVPLKLGSAKLLLTYSLEELIADYQKKKEFWSFLRDEINSKK